MVWSARFIANQSRQVEVVEAQLHGCNALVIKTPKVDFLKPGEKVSMRLEGRLREARVWSNEHIPINYTCPGTYSYTS